MASDHAATARTFNPKGHARHFNVGMVLTVLLGYLASWMHPVSVEQTGSLIIVVYAIYAAAVLTGLSALQSLIKDLSLRAAVRKALRGSGLHTARFATEAEMDKAGMFDPNSGRPLGSTHTGRTIFEPSLSPSGERKPPPHTFTIAPPGAGKTTCVAAPAIMHLPHMASEPSLVVQCVKGELTAQCAEALEEQGFEVWRVNATRHLSIPGVSLNPLGPLVDAVHSSNPEQRKKAKAIAGSMGHVLEPEPREADDKNKFFREGPRRILQFSMLTLALRLPSLCTPHHLWESIADPKKFEDMLRSEAEIGPPDLMLLAKDLLEIRKHDKEHFSGFRSEAIKRLEIYATGGLLEDVGAHALVRHEEILTRQVAVFLITPHHYQHSLGTHFAWELQAFMEAIKQRESKGRPVEWILDEMSNAPVQQLAKDLTIIRAFGGRAHVIVQALSEVERAFGRLFAKTLEAVTDVKQILGVSSFEEATTIAKALGEGEHVRPQFSFDGKGRAPVLSFSESGRNLLHAHELTTLDAREQIIQIRGMKPIHCLKLGQHEIAPICFQLKSNPIEGGKIPPSPKVWLRYPTRKRRPV